MPHPLPARRYRFATFEADGVTGELRRQGIRIKLNAQPFQVLLLLLDRPGDLLTREEICRTLWPDGTFVDYEHGLNSAINRIREALGDTAGNPRFIQTLARRGYRFLAPVEQINPAPTPSDQPVLNQPNPVQIPHLLPDAIPESRFLANPADLPQTSSSVVQTLYLLLQLMYLGFYVGALANLAEIEDLMAPLTHPTAVFNLMVVTAVLLIPVRAFLFSATLFHAPAVRSKLLKIWPILLPFDILWALSPFLLLHHINYGLALACTTLLVYSPFAQRALVLMGAGEANK